MDVAAMSADEVERAVMEGAATAAAAFALFWLEHNGRALASSGYPDGLTPAESAPRPGSPLPHPNRDGSHATPHLHRDRAVLYCSGYTVGAGRLPEKCFLRTADDAIEFFGHSGANTAIKVGQLGRVRAFAFRSHGLAWGAHARTVGRRRVR
jgi:hypothetical protein